MRGTQQHCRLAPGKLKLHSLLSIPGKLVHIYNEAERTDKDIQELQAAMESDRSIERTDLHQAAEEKLALPGETIRNTPDEI